MARNKNRLVDTTCLNPDAADERVIRSRDLQSHNSRWTNVARYLQKNHNYQKSIVLDVGCGLFQPLPRMLYSNRLIPLQYIGVDLNKLEIPEMLQGKEKMHIKLWPQTDVCALEPADVWYNLNPNGSEPMQLPNVLVCLEVAEHHLPEHTRRMFTKILELTSEDCHYFISTPNWDLVNLADNHVSEIRAEAFGAMLEDLGYHINGLWGTFASQKDYRPIMEERYPGISEIYEKLNEYYDSTMMSVIFAPLFPMESRNCFFHCTKKRGDAALQDRLFSALETCPTPWTSHPTWIQLSGKSHRHTDSCREIIRDDSSAVISDTFVCGKEGVWLG